MTIWTRLDTLAIAALLLLLGALSAHAQTVCTTLGGGDYVCYGGGAPPVQCSNLGGAVVCR